jgi:3D (Asp-Asp-Asp) domain-containing protein
MSKDDRAHRTPEDRMKRHHLHAIILGLLFGLVVAYAEAEAACATFNVSAYSLVGRTASGVWTGPGVVAVDPRVIPLGSAVWIEGMGTYTALDTGGAILGRMLDVWMPSYQAAIQFGRQLKTACW